MKKLITALAASFALASSAFAYSNLAATSDIGTVLSTYKLVSDDSVYVPNLNPMTSPLFTADSTTVSGLLANTEAKGGYLRTIFLGETAGYTLNYLNKSLDGSTTRTNVFGPINAPTKIKFADFVDITIPKASTVQLFLNTQAGYEFPIFNAASNVAYSIRAYTVNEYLTPIGADAGWYNVPTYVIGVEDLSVKQETKSFKVDWDYNDVVFAVQMLNSKGTPDTPVPEPSTYGLLGAAALVGLVAVRRFKSKK